MKNLIEVISASQVNVNGVNAGRVCDVLSNYKDDIVDIQAGLEAYEESLVSALKNGAQESAAAKSEAVARADKAEAALVALQNEHDAVKAHADELGRKLSLPERERKAEELQAASDQLAAQAAALRAPQ